MLGAMRTDSDRQRRTFHAFVLCLLCSGGLACGQDVMVGRWVLRSTGVDAGVEFDAGSVDNPQSVAAQAAREHLREHEDKPHDPPRPSDNKTSDKKH